MLIGLVALVGTASAWGDLYLICSQNSNWSNTTYTDDFKFTCVSENHYRATIPGSYINNGSWYFRFRDKSSDTWQNISPESTENDWLVSENIVSTNWQNSNKKSFYINQNADAKFVHIYCNWNGSKWEVSCRVVTTQTSYTVAFTNPNGWAAADVHAYSFNDGVRLTDAWPGTVMSDLDGDGVYSIIVTGSSEIAPRVIFNDNNSGDTHQSWTLDVVDDAVYDYSSKISSQTVNMNAYGMATYCSPYPLDFSGIEGLKAYKIGTADKTTGVLGREELGKVPAGTGVYLEGTANGSFSVAPTATATTVTGNLLKGVTENTDIIQTDGNTYTNYILTVNASGNNGTPKFYKVNGINGNTVLANRAYLHILEPNYSIQSMWFGDDELTSINALDSRPSTLDQAQPIYNLAGQKVSKNYKGVVIQNGKKYLIK
ncbi:MAG: starch-binding protein [Prevotella sp.]|nr:starch-binding protein [Prevotella sp.]